MTKFVPVGTWYRLFIRICEVLNYSNKFQVLQVRKDHCCTVGLLRQFQNCYILCHSSSHIIILLH